MLQENVLFPNLTQIKLEACSITDNALKTLAMIESVEQKFSNLQYIYLKNNQITDVGLKALAAAAGELKSL